MEKKKVSIIGAGIIGVLCACFLRREGHEVTLYDRKNPGLETSFGNSGIISPSAVVPIAMPGVINSIPGWLFKRDEPLSLDWNSLPKHLSWLVRFLSNSRESLVRRNSEALKLLNTECLSLLIPLLKQSKSELLIEKRGMLYVYRSSEEYRQGRLSRELRQSNSLGSYDVSRDALQDMEPNLSNNFVRGTFFPETAHSVNPYRLVKFLAQYFVESGGIFKNQKIIKISENSQGKALLETQTERMQSDICVVSAGIWSQQLLKCLNYHAPMISHRGYHVTVERPGIEMNTVVCPVGYMATIVPMEMGIRIGGTVELSHMDKPPNLQRTNTLLQNLKATIPNINTQQYTTWMGNRPCTPDSLPIIGRAPNHKSILFAFGHGHQGLLSAPKTAQVINDLVSQRHPSINLELFDITRFFRSSRFR